MNQEQQVTNQQEFLLPPPTNVIQTPIGSVIPFAGAKNDQNRSWLLSQGWIFCDGAEHKSTDYNDLYSVILKNFGGYIKDGVDYFNVPDCRGYFLRGVDDSAGVDPDRANRTSLKPGGNTGDNVGSLQKDEFAKHLHSYSKGFTQDTDKRKTGDPGGGYVGYTDSNTPTGDKGGAETRPVNIYMNFIIKFALNK